ncbi:MAG: hypothetical protein LBT89_07680 [Planctomycetaceae bacterium]|jgi:hypothetical protein|nr:hypothetical protein [Planctomycetaceae bacterium]
MTSPQPLSSEQSPSRHKILTPAKKIITSVIILLTGAGVAAVFWQMPDQHAALYDICDQAVVDQQVAAAPLPKEAISHATIDDIQQMSLPALDTKLSADNGKGKYAQAYPAPAALDNMLKNSAADAAKPTGAAAPRETEPEFVPQKELLAVQKIEPVRQMIPAVPITAETVDKTFQEKPKNSFDDSAVNDEMTTLFQFAENINAENASKAKDVPENPFSQNIAAAANTLKPLEPLLPQSRHAPLQPL